MTGVYEVDLQGNFTYFNNALCQVFGSRERKSKGANFSKFMDEEHGRAAFEIFNEMFSQGKGSFTSTGRHWIKRTEKNHPSSSQA